jgi:hypothetical protein
MKITRRSLTKGLAAAGAVAGIPGMLRADASAFPKSNFCH